MSAGWVQIVRVRPDRSPAFGLWLLALAAAVFGVSHALGWSLNGIASDLGDPDDALRLHQARGLLEGRGWYDLSIREIGGIEPLVSHWSRLADAPVAALLAVGVLLFGAEPGELVARTVWPVTLLVVLTALVAIEVRRAAGTTAGVIAIWLVASSVLAVAQFLPGRIDHHHLQIVGAVGGSLCLWRAFRTGDGALQSGLLFGIGLAIGYEALFLVLAILGSAGLIAVVEPRLMATLARVLGALSATLAAALAATVPPAAWGVVACDVLGLNLVVMATVGGIGTWLLANRPPSSTVIARSLGLIGVGVAAYAAQVVVAPHCAIGPHAALDPRIQDVWLDTVVEGRSIAVIFALYPSTALVYVATVGAAVALVLRRVVVVRAPADLMLAAIVTLAATYGAISVRFMPYGVWLALPVIAMAIATIGPTAFARSSVAKLGVAVLASHLVLHAALETVRAITLGSAARASAAAPETATCRRRDDIKLLTVLPPGFIVADIDIGPHIVADTHHGVLAGPYHRLGDQIATLHAILSSPPDVGVRTLGAIGADYVVLCAVGPSGDERRADLAGRLRAGASVAGLEPIDLGQTRTPLRAWRVGGR